MRKLLLVIDMQKDFVDGALGTPEAVEIVPGVVRKIESYPRENVIATRDTHEADYLQTQEGQKLPVVHCVRNTPGWEIGPPGGGGPGGCPGDRQAYLWQCGTGTPADSAGGGGTHRNRAGRTVYGHLCGVQRPATEGGDARRFPFRWIRLVVPV